jgi:hypothetical protein
LDLVDAAPAGREQSVSGEYTPLRGDFDGDGKDDVFWYARRGGTDSGDPVRG